MNTVYRVLASVLVLSPLAIGTVVQAQGRSMTKLSESTSRQVMIETFNKGSIKPVPVAQLAAPQSALAAPPPATHSGPESSLILPLNFGFNSDRLTLQARAILDVAADAMNDGSLINSRFLLEGHTDASGSWRYNKNLSERRALAVASYLTQRGVPRQRLMIVGYSWNRLLPGLSPYDGRHRRVELGRLQ